MAERSVIVIEKNSSVNAVDPFVGEVVKTIVFDESDTLGIIGTILSLVSECQDIDIRFDEREY